MNFIVFDLEFNQAYEEKEKNLNCPFEIIQIGAIKLDYQLNEISAFKSNVKPKIYSKIHPFVKQLTDINWDDLTNSEPFEEVYKKFSNFIGDNDNIFCVWGMADIKELFRNIKYYKLKYNNIPKQYINIQSYASKSFKTPRNSSIGLKTAIELLKLPMDNAFHDAYHDAYYTAEVFKHLDIKDVKPQIYNPNDLWMVNRNNRNNHKRKIDKHGLIGQFEKMYERKMTEEEKNIIILAYKMGLTGQFLLEK